MVILAAALASLCIVYLMLDAEEKIEAAQRKEREYEKFLLDQYTKKKFK